ncbi:MAG: lysophospholipid transporter LplT [Oxalobacter sp.]
MNKGFYSVMAAEFFSSLADNALLIVAIAILAQIKAPDWMTPLLRLFFVMSYIGLAAFVGAFADTLPKGKVMFITNSIKFVGCTLIFIGVHPLAAYAIVGIGAAAYSPAKYGILTELLPAEKLVIANGWIEGLTVTSIIMGTVLGGTLINKHVATFLQANIPFASSSAVAALIVILGIYILAALFNLRIPDTGARYEKQPINPFLLIRNFSVSFTTLWKDKLGQISLAVTTLFWGAGATLQFIVLRWAQTALKMTLDKAAFLQGIVAVGVAIGAVSAAKFIKLKSSLKVMPLGVAMGLVIMVMTQIHSLWVAYPLLVVIGALGGFFVVPMNALLQHRGHVLLSAGHSIAVQNFNENLSILTMLGVYSLLVSLDLSVNAVIVIFGSLVASVMLLVMLWHHRNQQIQDSLHLIGEEKRH